jgi:CRP-like cAMP-binding protein
MVSTRLKCLPLAVLLKAAKRDAKVALGLYEALSHELVATRERVLCVGQRGATERLATFFVILSRRNEDRGYDPQTIKLPMTRADISWVGEPDVLQAKKARSDPDRSKHDHPSQEYWRAAASCGR